MKCLKCQNEILENTVLCTYCNQKYIKLKNYLNYKRSN